MLVSVNLQGRCFIVTVKINSILVDGTEIYFPLSADFNGLGRLDKDKRAVVTATLMFDVLLTYSYN